MTPPNPASHKARRFFSSDILLTWKRRPIDKPSRNCIVSGVLSLALPLSGLVIFGMMALAGLALPPSHLSNQLTDILHIYCGIVFLLPIPLAVLTLILYIKAVRQPRRDSQGKGLNAPLTGLVLSGISTLMFIAVVVFFPTL
jgi:hypothetical protein